MAFITGNLTAANYGLQQLCYKGISIVYQYCQCFDKVEDTMVGLK